MACIRILSVLLVLGLVVAAGPAPAAAADADRYLVRYETGAKQAVLAQLGPGAVIHHEFDDLRLLSVTLPTATTDALAGAAGVSSVVEEPIHHLFAQSVPYGIDLVNARDAWDADRDDVIDAGAATGDGIRVCIVDTGIALDHEDLGGGGVNVLAGRSWVGEDWAADRQGHGTHVAGTVAAMHNQVGVVGVSPGAVELLIADVFNDAGDGQASSTILAAANWCADQGADIISMSLGGLVGTLADGYQAIYDRGVLVIAAAGNDGAPTINYPAGYPAVMSVAAVDANEAVADFSTFNPDVEIAAPGVQVLSTHPFENSLVVTGGPEWSANAMANADPQNTRVTGPLADGGDCNTAPPAGAYAGAIVLCERGGGPFRTKIDNAAAGGAVGAVVYNNVPGGFNGTYGDPCCSAIPAISLTQSDGQAAVGWAGSEATVNVNLVSTSGYAELSGTSMATPHASGTAAVIWSACPDLSHDQVRSHLTATTRESSQDLIPGRDIFYGFGIAQVAEGVAALTDGVDAYDPGTGNGAGNSPANVECPSGPDPEPGDATASGGGWLDGDLGKVTFGFDVAQGAGGASGDLSLKDHGRDVRVKISRVLSVTALDEACGPVSVGGGAAEIVGDGTLNSQPASFRVCVADRGQPGREGDRLYLECTSGCAYDTAMAAPDGALAGGNLKVSVSDPSPAESGEAQALVLDPVLLGDGAAGTVQVFTVRAFSAAGVPAAGADVTVRRIGENGAVDETSVVTGADGEATLSLALTAGTSEYHAVAAGTESNPVRVDASLD